MLNAVKVRRDESMRRQQMTEIRQGNT